MHGRVRLTHRPSQDVGDRGKHPCRGKIHGKIPHAHALDSRQNQIPDPAQCSSEHNDKSTLLDPVAEESDQDGKKEAHKIGRRRKALSIDGAIAHIFEDGGEEERQTGVAHIGTKVHEAVEPCFEVEQGDGELLDAQAAHARGGVLSRLALRTGFHNRFLGGVEKARLVRTIGNKVPGDGGHAYGGEALDEEEEPPTGDGRMPAGDTVRQGAGEGRRERRGRHEQTHPQPDLMPKVEEG